MFYKELKSWSFGDPRASNVDIAAWKHEHLIAVEMADASLFTAEKFAEFSCFLSSLGDERLVDHDEDPCAVGRSQRASISLNFI